MTRINFNNKAEYIFFNRDTNSVDVIVEQKEKDLGVKDYRLTLHHKINNGDATFEASYKEQKIIVSVDTSHDPIKDFNLPNELVGFTKDRIKEAINEYIDRY